ncbi:MAG: RsmB/NOP family class I SAM-dependent RNA methyltransferase [Alphaproteobacteria bacterium]|nr:RsmB/NOP family class I SAM-dependent RNA methyltransferase [Alphaproteobacteria bacterium]
MTPAARHQAAIEVLDTISDGAPAEKALTRWARGARYAGSKDRAAVRDIVFDALRRFEGCQLAGGGASGRAVVLGHLRLQDVPEDEVFSGAPYAPAPLDDGEAAGGDLALGQAAWNVPPFVAELLSKAYGDTALDIARALEERVPVFLRVNIARTTCAEAQQALREEGIETAPVAGNATALEVLTGARGVARSSAYAEGFVELQDAASQAVVNALPIAPGQRVLDYCAGGGGKALAMAARGADVSAYDISAARMRDLPPRAARGGHRIAVIDRPEGRYDLVLCDAPCSGSGSWRRDPDGKWRLTPDRLNRLRATQADILEATRDFVRKGGLLVYATCSILPEENAAQTAQFVARNPAWRLLKQTQTLPGPRGDGFFVSILAN